MIRHEPRMQLTRLAAELKTIDNPDNRYLYYRQLANFAIESKQDVHFNLDGEPTRTTKLKFSVLPQHLAVAL